MIQRLSALLFGCLLIAMALAPVARAQPTCGNEGQPGCGIFRTDCVSKNLKIVDGTCVHPNCGRDGQQACDALTRFPSCDIGLVEAPGAVCRVQGMCGTEGRRRCLVGEPGVWEPLTGCARNLVPQNDVCMHPNCGRADEAACAIPGRSSCDGDLVEFDNRCKVRGACGAEGQRRCLAGEPGHWEALTGCSVDLIVDQSVCLRPQCGGAGQRACCLGEAPFGACRTGLGQVRQPNSGACLGPLRHNAQSDGVCMALTPCGGKSQRACTIDEQRRDGVNACQGQLKEVGGCNGACFGSSTTCIDFSAGIGEPSTNSSGHPEAAGKMRGFADLHVHMFAHLAFGGGVFAGTPYDENGGIAEALRPDFATNLDLVSIDEKEQLARACPPNIPNCGRVILHGDHTVVDDSTGFVNDDQPKSNFGAPGFVSWPHWTSTTHQQVYYKWLERAWRGGLRLMVMHANNNEVLCWTSKHKRAARCDDSMAGADAQIQAAIAFEKWINNQPGGGWFKIVYSSKEAEQAIKAGKLAVVLGIEVDSLFNCKLGAGCTPESVRASLEKYYRMGVRHLYPIHDFDNEFGGTAVWMDFLNIGNRIIGKQWYVTEPCKQSDFILEKGPLQTVLRNAVELVMPIIERRLDRQAAADYPSYPQTPSCNKKGLTGLGKDLIRGMMDRGMLIDIDHMSALSIGDTMQLAEERGGYPLMAGHALFAEMHKAGGNRHERMLTEDQLARLRKLGGIVAVMTQDEMTASDVNTCVNSSRSFALNYLYAIRHTNSVAFGSDFNGVVRHVGPRYGDDACFKHRDGRQWWNESVTTPLAYPFEIKGFGIFDRQVTGQRTFDFNTDGLAHIGLYPDLIADMRAVGVSEKDLEPLFRSASDYVAAWQRAEGMKRVP